jgi:hypothetical protein
MKTHCMLRFPRRPALRILGSLAWAAGLGLGSPAGWSAEVLLEEGFNTDGEAANPKRYSTTGREVYEVDRQLAELGLTTQTGPIYWAHNFEVSYAGVPAPTAARRALMAWYHTIPTEAVTANALALFESTIQWLVNNQAGATICFSPAPAGTGDQVLYDHLITKGYNVIDDVDGTTDPPVADAYVKSSSSELGNPSRFATVAKPVLTYRGPDHDDLLVSSIGSTVTVEVGPATIRASGHPAAGGLTGTLDLLVAGTSTTLDLLGTSLPAQATTIAEFTQIIPATAANLADVDAMVAGTKPSAPSTGTATSADFALNSPGDWFDDHLFPGDPTGAFGFVGKGSLAVSQAGTYSFAMGVDDGGRLRIDRDRNGFTDADNVIVEDVGGAHRAVYGDAAFASAGTYDFEWTVFNSGGSSSAELSVSVLPGGNVRTPVLSGDWDQVGTTFATSPVTLQGAISVTVYVPTGAPEQVVTPFLVVLNGPTDTPPGSVFGGGPFNGFEGTGFYGASGIDKWPYPDGQTYRSLTLEPVNVTGKEHLKLTVAVAATFLDFETTDFLKILAYPGGAASEPVLVAHYAAPDANTKYFVDILHGNQHQLGLKFQDVTYDLPAGATELILEFQAATTWWNEIVAFDHVRVTAGATEAPVIAGILRDGQEVNLTWTGTGSVTVQGTEALGAVWADVTTTSEKTIPLPLTGSQRFFRLKQ